MAGTTASGYLPPAVTSHLVDEEGGPLGWATLVGFLGKGNHPIFGSPPVWNMFFLAEAFILDLHHNNRGVGGGGGSKHESSQVHVSLIARLGILKNQGRVGIELIWFPFTGPNVYLWNPAKLPWEKVPQTR